jgi:hypothetical protein
MRTISEMSAKLQIHQSYDNYVHKKLYVFGLVHEKIIASKRVFGNPGQELQKQDLQDFREQHKS